MNEKRVFAVIIGQFIIIVGLIIAVIVLAVGRGEESVPVMADGSTAQTEQENIPEYTEAQYAPGNENISPNEVIKLKDYTLGEIWIPVFSNVPKSSIDTRHIKTSKGVKSYTENGEKVSTFGIDVSVHQGDIDWEKVKADGVDFAIIRLGYRGYESGEICLDKNFEKNIEGATEAGIDVGVYFFSQATTVSEALEEAEFTLSYIEDYDITYPVVYDWEVIGESDARTDNISVETLTKCADAFLTAVENEGYSPMLYSNVKTALLKFDLSQLTRYPLWIAEYKYSPSFYYDAAMWQYTAEGEIDGIDHEVDLNICYRGRGST